MLSGSKEGLEFTEFRHSKQKENMETIDTVEHLEISGEVDEQCSSECSRILVNPPACLKRRPPFGLNGQYSRPPASSKTTL